LTRYQEHWRIICLGQFIPSVRVSLFPNRCFSIDSNISWLKQSKVHLPMHSSRFREDVPLISAVDICNRSASELFPPGQRHVSPFPLISPFQNYIFETFLCGELFSVACELHGLTYMLDLFITVPSKIGPVQREFFEDSYAAVQRALVSFPFPNTKGTIKSTNYYGQNAWRIAALVYLNTAIRAWPAASPIVQSFVSRLIPSLQLSDLPSIWSTFPDILAWILFVGSYVAVNTVDRDWFLLNL
jgi:hypothetical protein